MSETKLLPCPFCGGEAEILGKQITSITCGGCGIRLLYKTREEAIKEWNTRKPMKQIVERLEEELKLADDVKEKCSRENPLQFDSAKGYATGIYNAIKIVKEEGGLC